MKGHEVAIELFDRFKNRTLNEGNTRHHIIDRLLHEVLGWPHSSTTCEDSVHKGYIDYTLWDTAGHAALLIEAKREGIYFDFPKSSRDTEVFRRIRLHTLMTDVPTARAIRQAAAYCPQIGCEFACVTNGHEFIIFRAFIPGREFKAQQAIAIGSLSFFSGKFTKAYNLLGHTAVTANRSLHRAFAVYRGSRRELLYPKKMIAHYDAMVPSNQFSMYLDPLSRRYFGDISVTDHRMMQRCYVPARGTSKATRDLRSRITDGLTPFFRRDGAIEIGDPTSAVPLVKRIAKSVATRKQGDVLILYGGKGAGKSTFLRRLFYFLPPWSLRQRAFPIIVDCITAPQSKKALSEFIWGEILRILDQDHVLQGSIEQLIGLFEDRFQLAQKQELAGLQVGGIAYIAERNRLIMQWRYDEPYVVRRLQAYWAKKGKALVIAFDNTDQLAPPLQDHCFLLAQNIAQELGCIVIISMREERYCRARTAGVLDAYQNSGYHLAAPEITPLFERRLSLLIEDLDARNKQFLENIVPSDTPITHLRHFFRICLDQFANHNNAMRQLLTECSRDNMRLALQFFSQFASSGYTPIDEMIRFRTWKIVEHQIIKPMMVPTRYHYDENKSIIPNVFQYRTAEHGSHFTMVRILYTLRERVSASDAGFWRVDLLCDEFENRFGMRRDCEASLDVMLRSGLIEANNRLDSYSVEAAVGGDRIFADAVRGTTFGEYMLDYLCRAFAYLDLVSLDCGLTDESVYKGFCSSALQERALALEGDKEERLRLRLARVHDFIQYLHEEEERERKEYSIDADAIMEPIASLFLTEREKIHQSAVRNL